MKPTRTQLRLLSLLLPGDRYLEYRFDLGGVIVKQAGADSLYCAPGMGTVNACHARGWITYTVHQFGSSLVQIERRYVLTDSGRRAIHA